MTSTSVGKLLCVGIRGAIPGDPLLERDLDSCARADVGAVILFDVDVPAMQQVIARGATSDQAIVRAPRNITGPQQLTELIAHIRQRLGDDILVTIDQEGGKVARLNPRHGFPVAPSAASFARLNESEQQALAWDQASMLRRLGIDLNFAPCVDLALDPENEIIVGSGRSFGSDPSRVVRHAKVILDAHARAGLAACLKHFPGHGSSRDDTHRGAVDITDTWQREAELQPYRALAHLPAVSVMVAHVMHRRLDADHPASLSRAVIEGFLRDEIGFDGAVITDSIDMRAIADRWTPPEAVVAAVNAGADLVIDGFNLLEGREHPAVSLVKALEEALENGEIEGGPERVAASIARLNRLREQIHRSRKDSTG